VDSRKLHDWMQVVGIFAVVASLLFVGLEMRQSHEISLSQAYQSRVASVVEWNSAFAANPAALSAYRKSADGAADEITTEEHEALRSTLLGLFHLFDNAHIQYEKGFVSEEFWGMTRVNLKLQMMNPFANTIFVEKVNQGARPGFRNVVLSVNEELRTNKIDDL
jgi:hypothetical protein